jgi:hypothetical protein
VDSIDEIRGKIRVTQAFSPPMTINLDDLRILGRAPQAADTQGLARRKAANRAAEDTVQARAAQDDLPLAAIAGNLLEEMQSQTVFGDLDGKTIWVRCNIRRRFRLNVVAMMLGTFQRFWKLLAWLS